MLFAEVAAVLLSHPAIAPSSDAAAAAVPALRSKRRLDSSWAFWLASDLPNLAMFDLSRFPVLRS